MRRHKVRLTLTYDMDDEGAEGFLAIGRKAMKDGWDENLDDYVAASGGDPLGQAVYEYITASVWDGLREQAKPREYDFDVELIKDDVSVETYEEVRG